MKKLFQILAALTAAGSMYAQGTAFTYQGHLTDGSAPAGGIYDLRFGLYDATNAGSLLGNLQTNSGTFISNGLFMVSLDFGNQFSGAARWLEIAARTNGAAVFATLTPRQIITPTPYAMFAASASNINGTISAGQLSGPLALAQLPAGVVTNGASNVAFSGTFTGNGSGLTNVPPATNAITIGSPMMNLSLQNIQHPFADGWLNVPIGFNNWFQDGGIDQHLFTNHLQNIMGTNASCDMRAMLAPWGKQPYLQIDDSIFAGFDSNGIPTLKPSGNWLYGFPWICQVCHTNGVAIGIWLQAVNGTFNLAMTNCQPKVLAAYLISNHVDYVKCDGLFRPADLADSWPVNLTDGELDFLAALRGAPYPIHISGAYGNLTPNDFRLPKVITAQDSYRATSMATYDAMHNVLTGDMNGGQFKPLGNWMWMDVALANPQIIGANCAPDFDPMTDENWPGALRYSELTTFFSAPFQFGQAISPVFAGFENVYSNILSDTSIKIRRDLGTPYRLFNTNGVDYIVKNNTDGGIDLLLVNRNYNETVASTGVGSSPSTGPGYQLDLFTNYISAFTFGTNYQYVFYATNTDVNFSRLGLRNSAWTVYNAESDGRLTCTNDFVVTVPAGATRLFRLVPPVAEPSYRYLSNEKWFLYTNCTTYANYPYRNTAQGATAWNLAGSSTVYSNGMELIPSSMLTYGINGALQFTAVLGVATVAPAAFTNTITVFVDGATAAVWNIPNAYATNVSLNLPTGAKQISFQVSPGSYCFMTQPMLKSSTDGSTLTGLTAADGSPVMGLSTPVSLAQLPAGTLTNNANGVTLNGIISRQPTAASFNWAAIPPYSATTTNYWLGTWTNGTFVCLWSNTPTTYQIKQLAP